MLIAPGVHQIKVQSRTLKPARHTNVYVIGGDEVVIIDAGYAGDEELGKLLQLLKELGEPEVKLNIISHRHQDHYSRVDAVSERTGAKVAAHVEDARAIGEGLSGGPVDVLFKGGEELEADGKRIQVLHLPGHTPGMLNFYMKEEGLLFTSDNIVGFGTTWIGPPDGDMALYLQSLRELLNLEATKICPGHGPIIESPAEKIEEIIAHRLEREGQILDLIRDGTSSPEELLDKVYVKGEKIHPSLYTVARRTIEGHLVKLEREGRVVTQGDGEKKQYTFVRK